MARRRSISTRTRSQTKRTETSAPAKRTTRFVKASTAVQGHAPSARTDKSVSARPPRTRPANTRKKALQPMGTPEQMTWKDLATSNESRSTSQGRTSIVLGGVSTFRFVAGVLAVLVLVTLYVSHVNASRDLVQDVQALRRERLELQLELNRVSGDFERITGHTQIASRARDLGLTEAVPGGRPIVVHP